MATGTPGPAFVGDVGEDGVAMTVFVVTEPPRSKGAESRGLVEGPPALLSQPSRAALFDGVAGRSASKARVGSNSGSCAGRKSGSWETT